jgi:tetratricopeptide (TPR) repeat protein
MQLRWGDLGNANQQAAACLQGLPTTLAVNKQLQEETRHILYEDIAVEFAMCDDYEVPRHWECPKRLINLSRIRKIVLPFSLYPACPTRSNFPPLLQSAQKHGLNTRVTVLHLRCLASLLEGSQLRRELDVQVLITWEMMDTAESMKGIESIILPIMSLSNIHILRFSIKDSIKRTAHINPAKRQILAVIDMAKKLTEDQGRRQIVATVITDDGHNSPHDAADTQATVKDSCWTTLHQGASDGDEDGVQLSLKNGAEIEARDKNGSTALHYAARNGHLAIVQLLLEQNGININPKDNKGRTPLVKAVEGKHHEIVRLLLHHKESDANARDDGGRCALSFAAENSDEESTKLLLEHVGIQVESKDKDGRTPLSWVKSRKLEGAKVTRLLLEHRSVNTENLPMLDAIFNLGNLYRDSYMSSEAEKMYKRAIEGKKKLVGLDHLSTLDSLHDLAIFYADKERLAEAELVFQRTLEGYERTLGPEHMTTVGIVHDLGLLYRLRGKLSDAEEMLQRSVQAYGKTNGPGHISTLKAVHNLGAVYESQGRLAEAVEMYQRALTGIELAYGCSSPLSRTIQSSLKEVRVKISLINYQASVSYQN